MAGMDRQRHKAATLLLNLRTRDAPPPAVALALLSPFFVSNRVELFLNKINTYAADPHSAGRGRG
jgi:hypothetical protein